MARTKKDNRPVYNQIIIKAPTRKINDIGTWRRAIQSSDMGRPKDLFDLFDDLYLDGILYDAADKRIKAITNADITFHDKEGKEVDAITDLIGTTGFEDLLTILMKSRFYGRSGLEFDFANGFNVFEIPAKHINLEKKMILINPIDETGISYENDEYILVVGKDRDYGIFLRTAPYIIWKRGGFGDWAQWLEIFGMPQRVGKYNSYDPEARKLLEDAMEKAGSAPYLVIPKESDVETVQNTGTGSSGISYNQFRQACNEETLITVLGQTLTTVSGEKGARSLGEVHKEVEESKNKADMRFVQHILNTMVVPLLEKRGYPVQGGKFIFPKSAEPLTVADIVQLSDIMEIPTSYLHNKYLIPVPDGDEPVAKKSLPMAVTPIANADEQPFFRQLQSFFAGAPAVTTGAYRKFTTKLIDSITRTINLADSGEPSFRIDVASLFGRAIREIYDIAEENDTQPIINKYLFDITNNSLQQGISSEFSSAGFEFGKKNQSFIDEFKYNASVFAAFKNHQQTKEIVSLLTDGEGSLRSFYDFKKLALKVSKDYNTNWLRTEYNTAVRAARQAVNWKQFQDSKKMYPNLEYIRSTAKDKRPAHEEWAGTILPIDHTWWDTHYPPSDWNCQCSVRQTDKPATAIPSGSDGDPVFRNNPGKTARFLNLKEHPYAKGVCPYVNDCLRQKLNLADHPYREACKICLLAKAWHAQQLEWEQKKAMAPKDVSQVVKQSLFRKSIDLPTVNNHTTGRMIFSSRGLSAFLAGKHSPTSENKWILYEMAKNPNKIKYDDFYPLDMSRPNIQKKIDAGFTGYNHYFFTYDGKTWRIGAAIIYNRYEIPYFITIER